MSIYYLNIILTCQFLLFAIPIVCKTTGERECIQVIIVKETTWYRLEYGLLSVRLGLLVGFSSIGLFGWSNRGDRHGWFALF